MRDKMIKFIKLENSIKEMYIKLMIIESKNSINYNEYNQKIELLKEMTKIEKNIFSEILPYLKTWEELTDNDPLRYIIAEFGDKDEFSIDYDMLEEIKKENAIYDNLVTCNNIYKRILSLRNFYQQDELIRQLINNYSYNEIDELLGNIFLQQDISYLFVEEMDSLIKKANTKDLKVNKQIKANFFYSKYSELFSSKFTEDKYFFRKNSSIMKNTLSTLIKDKNYIDNLYIVEGENTSSDIMNLINEFIFSHPNIDFNKDSKSDAIFICTLLKIYSYLANNDTNIEYFESLYKNIFSNKKELQEHSIAASYIKNTVINLLSNVNTENSKKLLLKLEE